MAADQRRKRLNGASMVVYGFPEEHRTKRKNLGPVWNDLTLKSHVSLEWDGNQKRVVAKREQIGISWRQMRPLANFVPNGHNILADVFVVPQEIFGLDDLVDVLSYEVWNMHLLEEEKNLVLQFLLSDLERNQCVQELLSGDNFHFGNPFLKWGASLCSGEHHPYILVKQEQHVKSDKRTYYSLLLNYHKDIVGFLIKLKERWESCEDPRQEIGQKIWRLAIGKLFIHCNLHTCITLLHTCKILCKKYIIYSIFLCFVPYFMRRMPSLVSASNNCVGCSAL
ncbi:PREDICTED: uncharacterized protein LOC109338136 isoform X1 [Lupinus angustifolius]|uniref:uncharacterized protein LOC109338136 isoform X1 n=1 Tax=Lupinus angustifolius TaxID=3871 RepID=UPI00092E65B4|nr:PREDICTED: uncharacterized protein LOC109338136 isoform X1 [Lupinus angustifolius]